MGQVRLAVGLHAEADQVLQQHRDHVTVAAEHDAGAIELGHQRPDLVGIGTLEQPGVDLDLPAELVGQRRDRLYATHGR